MVRVLHLAPVRAAADAIAPLHMFVDDALQPHQTDMREQLGTDLADLELARREYPPDGVLQQLGQTAFAVSRACTQGVDVSFWQLSGNLMISQSITARDPMRS